MLKTVILSICLCSVLISVLADIEHEHHGHHHAHDGHDHHNHESHRKLFADGSDDETEKQQLEKLRSIARKIDIDADGRVSREEMRVYINERLEEQNRREADEFISTLDPHGSKLITFDAYVEDNFGQADIKDILKSNKVDPISRETRRTYLADKTKWEQLDKNGDGSLTYEEFRKFLRPEDDDALLEIEVNSMVNEYDTDKDGKISNDEYRVLSEAETGQSEPLSEELDTNNDGYADFFEFAKYYWPASGSNVLEETDHLMKECDRNQDGFCSYDEILKAYSSFAGSQATDYGADLDSDHDEF